MTGDTSTTPTLPVFLTVRRCLERRVTFLFSLHSWVYLILSRLVFLYIYFFTHIYTFHVNLWKSYLVETTKEKHFDMYT